MTIIKKFNPEEGEKKSSKKPLLLAGACIFTLVVIQIWINNAVVSYGEKFDSISKLKLAIKMENQILENEIANASSIVSVASKSAELGFSKIDNIQYIR